MNSLSNEKSLYLKQHSTNPVDWMPWNQNVLRLASNENKLLIISIGYSSCHWCHVMEEETFSNEDAAKIMNSNFINIKVDREERPDIDELYMKSLVLMTGSGGWPMNIIALPDGSPIWGGTYLPKENWINVLTQINELFTNSNINQEKAIQRKPWAWNLGQYFVRKANNEKGPQGTDAWTALIDQPTGPKYEEVISRDDKD